jgi:hypothetical protein
MAHAIIRGGRRYEVDFGNSPVHVEVYASKETVEIFVEADFETHAEERRRFAIINIPRHCLARLLVGWRDAQQHMIVDPAAAGQSSIFEPLPQFPTAQRFSAKSFASASSTMGATHTCSARRDVKRR